MTSIFNKEAFQDGLSKAKKIGLGALVTISTAPFLTGCQGLKEDPLTCLGLGVLAVAWMAILWATVFDPKLRKK